MMPSSYGESGRLFSFIPSSLQVCDARPTHKGYLILNICLVVVYISLETGFHLAIPNLMLTLLGECNSLKLSLCFFRCRCLSKVWLLVSWFPTELAPGNVNDRINLIFISQICALFQIWPVLDGPELLVGRHSHIAHPCSSDLDSCPFSHFWDWYRSRWEGDGREENGSSISGGVSFIAELCASR